MESLGSQIADQKPVVVELSYDASQMAWSVLELLLYILSSLSIIDLWEWDRSKAYDKIS